MENEEYNKLSVSEKIHYQCDLVIKIWEEDLGIERTWDPNLHIADILDKHIFPQIEKKLAVSRL